MIVAFTLTMPNSNSWNGRWSGEGRCYAIVRSYTSKKAVSHVEALFGNHYYDFGDGWGANVNVREVDRSQAARLRKESAGFAGYDWMIDSLFEFGKIGNSLHQEQWLMIPTGFGKTEVDAENRFREDLLEHVSTIFRKETAGYFTSDFVSQVSEWVKNKAAKLGHAMPVHR